MTCPNCGEANPERARFCLNCGAALQAPEGRRDVRKVVTVVYCDVTGSTALGERLDPEPLGQVMGRWYEAMRLVVERHRGRVQKFIGDAVLATFGVPVLREDDALRAVRAAAGMQDALAELNAALTRDWGVGLEVRVGVSTGEVVVGDPRPGGALVVGDAVNRAERLQAAARPGEVLLDRQTWQLARDAVVVAPVAPEELADPLARVDAYRLVDVSPDALGHARRHEGLLVGRADELQLFDWVYRRAVRESTCHLLTVLGAAGVGKSRLVAEAVEAVGEAATVLLGHCLPDAEGSTFWPVAQAVRAAAEVKRADSPEEARAKLDGLLGGAADGARVADRIGRLIGLEDAPLPAEETVWAVRRFLEVLASRRPLLLILDDLHWAQPTLLDLVEQLVDLTREAPILLVAVARPELLEQRPTWAGGKLNASTVMLEPLDERESATLLAQLAGEATLPEEAAAAITRTAEGNPLFLEELLATLIEEGRLEHRDGRWVGGDLATVAAPPSIHALLAARLDRLGAGERGLIERAAVIGHAFDPAALAALTPPADRAEVPAQLDSLVRRELLRPADPSVGGRGWYQFRHLLVRDAAYDSLPKQTRAELHERYAGWLAERVGARSREYEEILGYHLERAHRFLAELGPVDAHGVGLAAAAAERLAAAGRRA
ncbi:MAG TPA: AAA family ATPase, partial [Actinomycetes bacterium]|nr:AAA family ATPase [Actinomycetes bacterium]